MEFLEAHANFVLALGGAVGGALISLVVGWLLRKRDYDLRLWDKLLERRIQAHENLIKVALEMRVMVALGTVDAEGEVIRAPQVLVSQEAFEQWFTAATGSNLKSSTWLATDAKREANFLQDYLVTLHLHLQLVASEDYLSVGSIIRQDFIDISVNLERSAFRFFEKDARRLRLSSLDDWHKHPREQTEKKLKDTQLLQRWSEWSPLAQKSGANRS